MAIGATGGLESADDATQAVRIWLLGGLRVHVGGREVAELGRWQRPAALLKILALAPGHAIHREQAQELLWPELASDAAANNLHGTIHLLRRLLEPELQHGGASAFVVLQSNVLRLRSSDALWIDVEAFELAAGGARRSRESAMYDAALALYGGDLLPEDIYADWAANQRVMLHAQFVDLLHGLASIYEEAGELSLAVRSLARLVSGEPADEDAAAHLMGLYAQLGQRQQAVRQFRLLERALRRELDCEPDAHTARLRDDIVHAGAAAQRVLRPLSDRHPKCAPLPLTGRERQITDLVARGLSNRNIAAALGVSTRTAETHVSRILHKLDVCSREQVALAISGS